LTLVTAASSLSTQAGVSWRTVYPYTSHGTYVYAFGTSATEQYSELGAPSTTGNFASGRVVTASSAANLYVTADNTPHMTTASTVTQGVTIGTSYISSSSTSWISDTDTTTDSSVATSLSTASAVLTHTVPVVVTVNSASIGAWLHSVSRSTIQARQSTYTAQKSVWASTTSSGATFEWSRNVYTTGTSSASSTDTDNKMSYSSVVTTVSIDTSAVSVPADVATVNSYDALTAITLISTYESGMASTAARTSSYRSVYVVNVGDSATVSPATAWYTATSNTVATTLKTSTT
jgi:hypothetical protein